MAVTSNTVLFESSSTLTKVDASGGFGINEARGFYLQEGSASMALGGAFALDVKDPPSVNA